MLACVSCDGGTLLRPRESLLTASTLKEIKKPSASTRKQFTPPGGDTTRGKHFTPPWESHYSPRGNSLHHHGETLYTTTGKHFTLPGGGNFTPAGGNTLHHWGGNTLHQGKHVTPQGCNTLHRRGKHFTPPGGNTLHPKGETLYPPRGV